MGDRQWFVLYVLVCLEIGVFLMLVPWSTIWERNYFLDLYPALRPWVVSPSLRGAVCGLGLANIFLGISEVYWRWKASVDAAPEDTSRGLDRSSRHEASNPLAAPEEP